MSTTSIPAVTTNTPATTPATAASTSSGSGSSALNLASNFNTFLTLLTTQLQNQDPTSPVDSNQFTQQLVEFAGVQQQVQTNTLLSQLVSATQGNQVSSASSFIGTTVQATGNQAGLTSGGSATFGYTLASAAANAVVTIKDASGNVVYVGNGSTNSGANSVSWDGTNSLNGSTEPAGTYSISVQATDASGNAITATPYETGTVSSASISNGVVMLNVGGLQIPETSVTSVTGLNGTSSGSGLSSQISSLSSALSSLPSEISSSVSSALQSIL
jgi:flagellar basal-body rod modification protein FlgD